MTVLGATDVVVCPIDHIEFRPYYTDGECPICGWRPTDPVARPWWQATDPVWVAFLAMVAVIVVMTVVVVAVYVTD